MATATSENVARSYLAGLGNDSPAQSQINAVMSWIKAEGVFGTNSPYANNPLDVTLGNVRASESLGYLPSSFSFTVPDPGQNGGNPVLGFGDLTSGIMADIAGTKQAFAAGIRNLLSTPKEITTEQLSQAVSASGWGTGPFGGVAPVNNTGGGDSNPGSGSGGIGVGAGGQTQTGNSLTGACSDWTIPFGIGPIEKDVTLPGSRIFCLISTFISSPQNWAKAGLTVLAAGLIIAGLVLYVKGEFLTL